MTALKKFAEILAEQGVRNISVNDDMIYCHQHFFVYDTEMMKVFFREFADILRARGHKVADISSGNLAAPKMAYGFQLVGKNKKATKRKISKIIKKYYPFVRLYPFGCSLLR